MLSQRALAMQPRSGEKPKQHGPAAACCAERQQGHAVAAVGAPAGASDVISCPCDPPKRLPVPRRFSGAVKRLESDTQPHPPARPSAPFLLRSALFSAGMAGLDPRHKYIAGRVSRTGGARRSPAAAPARLLNPNSLPAAAGGGILGRHTRGRRAGRGVSVPPRFCCSSRCLAAAPPC